MPLAPAVEPRPGFVRGPRHPRAGLSNLSLPLATLLPRVIATEMEPRGTPAAFCLRPPLCELWRGGPQDSGRAPRSLQTVAGCWKSTCPAGPRPETGPLVVSLLSTLIPGLGAPAGRVTRRGAGPTWDPPRHGGAWPGLPGGDELASLPPEPSLAAFILEGFVSGQEWILKRAFHSKRATSRKLEQRWLAARGVPEARLLVAAPVRGSVGAPKCHSRTLTRGTPSLPGGVSLSLKKGSLLKPERPQNQDPERGPWGRLTIARPPRCSRHALGEKFFRFPCLALVSSAS